LAVDNLTTDVLLTWDEIKLFETEWIDLHTSQAVGSCFFNDPRRVLSLRNEYEQPCVIAVREGRTLVAVASLVISSEAMSLQIGGRQFGQGKRQILRGFGDDFLIYSSKVDLSAAVREVFSAVDQLFNAGSRRFAGIYLRSLDVEGALYHCVEPTSELVPGWKSILVHRAPELFHSVEIARGYEDYLQSLGSKSRQMIKQAVKRFYQRNQGETVSYSSQEGVEKFLDQLNQVYQSTWQAGEKGIKKNRCSPEQVEKYRRFADLGWLRSYILTIDNQPVAYLLGFQYCGVFEFVETGYHPDYAEHSPGKVILAEVIKDLHAYDCPKVMRMGWGDFPYKRWFGNKSITTQQLYLVPRGSFRNFLRLQYALNVATSHYLRPALSKLGLEARIKSLLRR
jgi:Acetyltransferase (GNAT) domain